MSDPGELTRLLKAYGAGDREALDRLFPMVYEQLRVIARSRLGRGGRDRTLDTVGLIHETYLRLVDQTSSDWSDRQHFFRVCSRAMRQIVISDARRRLSAKRGLGQRPAPLDEERVAGRESAERLLAVDQALDRLAARSERMARVFECRYFAGLTEEETAEALGASLRTVQRDWLRARAWLREDLGGEAGGKRGPDEAG